MKETVLCSNQESMFFFLMSSFIEKFSFSVVIYILLNRSVMVTEAFVQVMYGKAVLLQNFLREMLILTKENELLCTN